MPPAPPSPTRRATACGTGLQLAPEVFYDQARIAIVPWGSAFPATTPRRRPAAARECARIWHERLFAAMPQLELILAVGSYAQRWHLAGSGAADA